MSYELVWEPNGIRKRFWGSVDGATFIRSAEQVGENLAFSTLRYVINEMIDVVSFELSSSQLDYYAAINRGSTRANPNLRVAFVGQSPCVEIVVTTLNSDRYAGGHEARSFSSLQQARCWLAEPREFRHAGPMTTVGKRSNSRR